MSIESVLMAIANALRPTGIAAVLALLATPAPRRLLFTYIAVGFAWSFAVGVVVVGALHGVKVETGSSTANAVLSLSLGAAAVGFAAGIAAGRSRSAPPGGRAINRGWRAPSGIHRSRSPRARG